MKTIIFILVILFLFLAWRIYILPPFEIPQIEFSETIEDESGFTFKRPRRCRRRNNPNSNSSYTLNCSRRGGPIIVQFISNTKKLLEKMRSFRMPNGQTAFYTIERRDNPGSGGDEYTLKAYVVLGDTTIYLRSVDFGEFGRPSFGLAWAVLNSVG